MNEYGTNYEKEIYHTNGKRALRQVAKKLGLKAGEYDLRSNKGGPAVMGEITLHTDTLYVQICEGHGEPRVMYRTCKGRSDYAGGPNKWMLYKHLTTDAALETFNSLRVS